MPNLCRIALMGHLGRDPEMKTAGSSELCEFSIAVNSPRRKDDQPTWFRISVWGKQGEMCERYLKKGSGVYVDGDLDVRAYTTKDGDERVSYDVNASKVQFLGKGDASDGGGSSTYSRPAPGDGHDHGGGDDSEDGIPF